MIDNISELITRRFTKELENNSDKTVYDLFKWKKVNVFMKDYKTGKVLCDMKDLEFPESYSQNACDIIASKYFRKAGVPNTGHETSMRQIADRIISFYMMALKDEGIIKTEEQASIFYDEAVYALLNQMFAPNSPAWFNCGLKLKYDISGESQGYYYDENKHRVVKCKDNYTRAQTSACFILSIKDSLLGPHSITDNITAETKLFKNGSGAGSNFSNIRAKGERLSGGGKSSGLMSFLKIFDQNAGAIKSGGTVRRASKIVGLDIDHPEIVDFISWKAKEEKKVRALGKMGYDTDIDGEAYETVSGQNANNSIRVSDEFMKKVENLDNDPDAEIELKGRVDNSVNKKIKVKDLWNLINQCGWECADPGIQFDDRFNEWHTCKRGESGSVNDSLNRINSCNPCGEYAFLDNTACNLASINIYKFYNSETNEFDIEGYRHLIHICQLILEASIQWGQFPTTDIARKSYKFRPTGLGISNLASLLMAIGYSYDSENARDLTSGLVAILTGESYYTSALMAKEVGAFSCYKRNKKYMDQVIEKHRKSISGLTRIDIKDQFKKYNRDHEDTNSSINNIILESINSFNRAIEMGINNNYGFRNAQVTVIAPTGTISFAMDCASTSIEPFFSHTIYKKLVGGGSMTITNPIVRIALTKLGLEESDIDNICKDIEKGESIEKYEDIIGKENISIFDTAMKLNGGERYIDAMGHVKMMAAITPLISGSISKTVNLPNDATVDDFKNVILQSWKLGVKGITLYRDGSKAAQPLNTSLDDNKEKKLEDLSYKELLNKAIVLEALNKLHTRAYKSEFAKHPQEECKCHCNHDNKSIVPKRIKMNGIRKGTTHNAIIDGVKIYITVNRDSNNDIKEIYITTDREGTIIMGLLNSVSKLVSVMLQYGVEPKNISKILRGQKYEPYGFVQGHPYIKRVDSISDLVSKIIDIELGDYSRCQIKPSITEKDTVDKVIEPIKNTIESKKSIISPECCDTLFSTQKELEDNLRSKIDDYEEKNLSDNNQKEIIKDNSEIVYGQTCPNCGSTRMVRNGTCYVCRDCGTTTGCS